MRRFKAFSSLAALGFLFGCGGGAADQERLDSMSLSLGTAFESRTVTRVETPSVADVVTFTRHTLRAISADEMDLELEMTQPDGSADRTLIRVPHRPVLQEGLPPGVQITASQERCAVPAGTFDCTKTVMEVQQGGRTRSVSTWTARELPVPLRSVIRNESVTSVTELIRVDDGA